MHKFDVDNLIRTQLCPLTLYFCWDIGTRVYDHHHACIVFFDITYVQMLSGVIQHGETPGMRCVAQTTCGVLVGPFIEGIVLSEKENRMVTI